MKDVIIVVAADQDNGIGLGNSIPWRIKADMKFFRELTSTPTLEGTRNAVIMGRKTWDSIPESFRPLKDRVNHVVSRSMTPGDHDGFSVHGSLDTALEHVISDDGIGTVFVIGGGEIYKQALDTGRVTGIHMTRVHSSFGCDTHFPEIPSDMMLMSSSGDQAENGLGYTFSFYSNRR